MMPNAAPRRATTFKRALEYQLDACCEDGQIDAMVVADGDGLAARLVGRHVRVRRGRGEDGARRAAHPRVQRHAARGRRDAVGRADDRRSTSTAASCSCARSAARADERKRQIARGAAGAAAHPRRVARCYASGHASRLPCSCWPLRSPRRARARRRRRVERGRAEAADRPQLDRSHAGDAARPAARLSLRADDGRRRVPGPHAVQGHVRAVQVRGRPATRSGSPARDRREGHEQPTASTGRGPAAVRPALTICDDPRGPHVYYGIRAETDRDGVALQQRLATLPK